MKAKVFMFLSLITLAISLKAQIPNNSFENWISFGNYENPQGYATTNSLSAGSFYPVTKSADHYPVEIGNYSIRIQNDTTYWPNLAAAGITWTGDTLDPNLGQRPAFPVTGHPDYFCGYYKFLPENGDSMKIQLILFQEGTGAVAAATLITPVAADTWTSFIIPISSYAEADSGNIMLSSFNASKQTSRPYGNSVLYVDNLSFDQLITSNGPENPGIEPFTVYPVPAHDQLVIETFPGHGLLKILITDLYGHELVFKENYKLKTVIDISSLISGVYFVKLMNEGAVGTKKFIKY